MAGIARNKEREVWRKRHRALVRIMYADPDWELNQVEIGKARLEIEESRANITAS